MILSMTGFGISSSQEQGTAVKVEIRTVNHRFLDLHIRVPREHAYLESDVQQSVRNALGRGRVDVNVTIQSTGTLQVGINVEAARGYVAAARKLGEDLRIPGTLDLSTMLALPGVLQNRDSVSEEAPDPAVLKLVRDCVQQALAGVLRMRQQEGDALRADLLRHLQSIQDKAATIKALGPSTVVEYRQKLEERLAQLLPQNGLDPQRLAQEVALLVDRSDISEEITRLDSHLKQYGNLIASEKDAGKKMDFLLQEMQREVNTVLSKTGNLEITRCGIGIKADIEKLREQVQNVE